MMARADLAPELLAHLERVSAIVSDTSMCTESDVVPMVDSARVVFVELDERGRVIAHCALYEYEHAGLSHRLSVSGAAEPHVQRSGVGRKLLSEACSWSDAHGYDWIDADVWADNVGALALDASCGFVEVGRLRDALRRGGRSYDRVVMARAMACREAKQ